MYSVYTQPRPGRPRWALVSSGVLLLLTIGLAQGLIELKDRGHRFTLGTVEAFEMGRLRCPMPSGWRPFQPDAQIRGVVAAYREPAVDDRPGRQILVLREIPASFGIPSHSAKLAALRTLQSLMSGKVTGGDEYPARAGSLPAWHAELETITMSRSARSIECGLARAVMAPAGQIVVIALTVPGQMRGSDRRLVDAVAAGLILGDVSTATDPSALMQAAGIRFSPPSEATFLTPAHPGDTTLRLFGGQEQTVWFLDVCRVPLVGKRRPENIVTDCALSLLQQPGLPEAVQTQRTGGRETARIELSPAGDATTSILICASRIDDGNAVLLVGRYEQKAQATLTGICESITSDATLTGPGIDLAAARENAKSLLKTLAAGVLQKTWASDEARHTYRIEGPGISFGRVQLQYGPASLESSEWWAVNSKVSFELLPDMQESMPERWLIRQDLRAHKYVVERTIEERKAVMHYEEDRSPGAAEVSRKVTVLNGGLRSGRAAIDDTFAPEPVLLRAAALVALDPASKPAVFNMTDAFTEGSTYLVVAPLGEQPLPSGGGRTCRAVSLRQDCDTAPEILYYNRAQVLVAVGFSNGTWRELEPSSGPAS